MTTGNSQFENVRTGSIVDNIPAGKGQSVLTLLGVDAHSDESARLVLNVASEELGRKDVVGIEGEDPSAIDRGLLAVIAPGATIKEVRNSEVITERTVERPDRIESGLRCPNDECITNHDEPVTAKFGVLDEGVRCEYCDEIVTEKIIDLYTRDKG